MARRVVEGWVRRLLAVEWEHTAAAAQALANLARRTGDRERDLDQALRDEVVERIAAAGTGHVFERARELVIEGGELGGEEASAAFGEALPEGLVLVEQ
jgi:hypothetical protein